MRLLVTGATGFIGSRLCMELCKNTDYHITAVDNCLYNNYPHFLHLPNYTFIKDDYRNLENLDRYNFVVHLAAIVGAPACEAHKDIAEGINLDGVKELVKKVRGKLIFCNTNSMYGQSEEKCTEESPCAAVSDYGRQKYEAEQFIKDNHQNFISLRLATVAGISPRFRNDLLVNTLTTKFYYGDVELFDPRARRNYVHIADVVRAIIWSMNPSIQGIFNVGLDSANCTKLELAMKIRDLVNPAREINISEGHDPDSRDYEVSSQKIMRAGFQFKYSIEQAVYEVLKLCKIYPREMLEKMGNVNS